MLFIGVGYLIMRWLMYVKNNIRNRNTHKYMHSLIGNHCKSFTCLMILPPLPTIMSRVSKSSPTIPISTPSLTTSQKSSSYVVYFIGLTSMSNSTVKFLLFYYPLQYMYNNIREINTFTKWQYPGQIKFQGEFLF